MKIRNLIFFISLVLYSCGQTRESDSHARINLEGQPNFRDMGGYVNFSGTEIKRGMVYRSGSLSRLNERDVSIIDSLGIKTVVNFLTEDERKVYGEDVLPAGVKSVLVPITGDDNEADIVLEARQTGDFSRVPVELNYNIHALLVEAGKDAYRTLFEVLAEPDNYPLVFHCSHGVHRTGTAAALLLWSLDVPWDIIVDDYLLSNTCRQEEIEKRVQDLYQQAANNPEVRDKEQNLKNIKAFYQLDAQYIEGTRDAIEQGYGSLEEYMSHIGIDSVQMMQIKKLLLVN